MSVLQSYYNPDSQNVGESIVSPELAHRESINTTQISEDEFPAVIEVDRITLLQNSEFFDRGTMDEAILDILFKKKMINTN